MTAILDPPRGRIVVKAGPGPVAGAGLHSSSARCGKTGRILEMVPVVMFCRILSSLWPAINSALIRILSSFCKKHN